MSLCTYFGSPVTSNVLAYNQAAAHCLPATAVHHSTTTTHPGKLAYTPNNYYPRASYGQTSYPPVPPHNQCQPVPASSTHHQAPAQTHAQPPAQTAASSSNDPYTAYAAFRPGPAAPTPAKIYKQITWQQPYSYPYTYIPPNGDTMSANFPLPAGVESYTPADAATALEAPPTQSMLQKATNSTTS